MASQVNWLCDEHDSFFECPDELIEFISNFQEYGLIIHDGGASSIEIPAEFQDERWLTCEVDK
ncbi:hypothetical protein AB0I10_40765 [Streptomyces sp. NPDC050636]|uniref:DUF6980 family protein n=1 Tax=Streptomyces sp. NPDC050636 TaxID=3154510 RepID=UPI0034352CF4